MVSLVRSHLSRGNTFRLRVLGLSMYPAIRPGDVVRVNVAADYSVGDIVLYTRGDDWVAHRLRSVGRPGDAARIVTRGDALRHPDPPVPLDAVLGRVDAIERGGRLLWTGGLRGRTCRLLARAGFPWHRVVSAACAFRGRAGRQG